MRKRQEKWEKRDGCGCRRCREVEVVVECKDDFDFCPEKKWDKRDGCDCHECREITINVECNRDDKKDHDKKDDDKKDHDKKDHDKKDHDPNKWVREILERFTDRNVVIFTRGNTHTEGTVDEVKKDYVVLVPTPLFPGGTDPVEVENNIDSDNLEVFQKYFIRLDDIVGFGQQPN